MLPNEYYDQPLTSLDQPWGGGPTTDNKRVAGRRVEAIIKESLRANASAIEAEVTARTAAMTNTSSAIGNIAQLQTTDKSSIVAAINELKEAGINGDRIGTATYTDIF